MIAHGESIAVEKQNIVNSCPLHNPRLSKALRIFLCLLVLLTLAACSSEKARRLQWNLKTTVEAYEKIGHHNQKWDAPAKEALTLFARWRAGSATDFSLVEPIAEATQKAISAGCSDPLILYVHARFGVNRTSRDPMERLSAHKNAADGFKESEYSDLRKFYGCLRAAEAYSKLTPPRKLDMTELMNDAANFLANAIDENDAPYGELFHAARAFMYSFGQMRDNFNTDRGWHRLEPLLRKQWGNGYREKLGVSEVAID
jgi:hypothetical protein